MLDLSTRYRAVVHYSHFLPSLRKVARIYQISKSSLQRWVSGHHPKRRARRIRDIKADVKDCITSTLERTPMATIADVQRAVTRVCGGRRSVRTVGRAVAKSGYTFKKAYRFVASPASAEDVVAFCTSLAPASQPMSDVVWVDEAGFYIGDHASRGYAVKGRRLRYEASRTLRRSKLTLVMAMTRQGVLHYEVLDHNCRKADFVQFISDLPVARGTRIVMDNIQFHKSQETRDALRSKGCFALYTPPYSPCFNAIEYAFSTLKRVYRHACSELQAQESAPGTCMYEDLLHATLMMPHDFGPFVSRVGDTVQLALASEGRDVRHHDG